MFITICACYFDFFSHSSSFAVFWVGHKPLASTHILASNYLSLLFVCIFIKMECSDLKSRNSKNIYLKIYLKNTLLEVYMEGAWTD